MSDRRSKLVPLAAELAADFATRAGEHDRNNSFPFENVDKMKAAGYTALVIPEKHGGLGADLEDFALCQEQLAQGCAATTIAINMHLFGIGSMVERATGAPAGEIVLRRDRSRPSNSRRRDQRARDRRRLGLLRDSRAPRGRDLRPQRPQNLHQPVAGDRFVHGDGDDRGFQSARRQRPSSCRAALPALSLSRPGTRWGCGRRPATTW